jgi:putative restriction endonuclease
MAATEKEMILSDLDSQVRLAAFRFLDEQTRIHGEVLARKTLERGFDFNDERVPLISPKGIFTPRIMTLPLTFCTVPPSMGKVRPYDDGFVNGVFRYRYRGTDPSQRDNAGLRKCSELGLPLIYLYGVVPGEYIPVWPVFIVGDDPANLSFRVDVDDKNVISDKDLLIKGTGSEDKRRYITVETQHRLHQQSFRLRILRAYRERCAICHLQHEELLEAAHIVSDKHPLGEPIIPNGLALCKLHHAAFERNILGISPDYVIDIRRDILEETDGPMLKYGLQQIQGQSINTPKTPDWKPSRDLLAIRFDEFRKAV